MNKPSFVLVLMWILTLAPLGRAAEVLALGDLAYKGKPLAYWIAALETSHSISPQPKQAEAEEAIHALGPDAIPAILKYPDKDRDQRLRLIQHACAILEPEGNPKLVEALHDSDPAVRETALTILPKSVLPSALEDLLSLVIDPVRPVRAAAILALVRLAPQREETIAALVDALHDLRPPSAKGETDFTREDAALTLASLGAHAKAAVPELASLLADPNEGAREAAATALWKIERNVQGLPALVDRLESARDYQTCLRVMKLLSEMGPPAKAAVPVLRQKLEDPGVSFVPPTVNFGQSVAETIAKIDPAAGVEARKKLAELARENP